MRKTTNSLIALLTLTAVMFLPVLFINKPAKVKVVKVPVVKEKKVEKKGR